MPLDLGCLQTTPFADVFQVYDLPKPLCSDEGIARVIDEVVPSASFSRTTIGRNVKELPELIKEHDQAVRDLEKVLAKYLKNPHQVPASKPTCKPSKKDPSFATYPPGTKLDAIEYLTGRIKYLEIQIKETRAAVDKRSTMPYGFASYSDIAEAHSIAYTCRKKKPQGATIRLAPRPNDIIWDNLPLSAQTRSRKRMMNNIWVTLLTLAWVAPNALIGIFLVSLSNLGRVWPAFKAELERNSTVWGMVQGILSPALLSLFYIVLPIIFRRMLIAAGDQSKTGRERHVLAKLYSFFVFNNLLVVSLFGAVWGAVAGIIEATDNGENAWEAFQHAQLEQRFFMALCGVSPFWITYLLQRHLGAAIDLSQMWPLVQKSFMRRFASPTPRELIELTAPPPFDYASYYNYFLFYATIGLCYSGIQPLVLPAAALYFVIDSLLKKYLLLYVFVTKNESGGMYWPVVFNRMIFGTILADVIYFLTTFVRGGGMHEKAFAIVPLPLLMIGFKIYCSRVFDDKIYFFSTRNVAKHPEEGIQKESRLRSERLASRFGHPALYKPLITPMVHQNAQNMLHSIYSGRLSDGREADAGDMATLSGYSDSVSLSPMRAGKPGAAATVPGFEFVSENHLDFEYYKGRSEFAEGHGAGEIFGTPSDVSRPGTPSSTYAGSDGPSRPGTPQMGGMMGAASAARRNFSAPEGPYSAYSPSGRASPGPQAGFLQQPVSGDPPRPRSALYSHGNDSSSGLVRTAAGMPVSRPGSAGSRDASVDRGYGRGYRGSQTNTPGPSHGALGGGPQGYSGLAQSEEPPQEPAPYDYFRGGRSSRKPGEGW